MGNKKFYQINVCVYFHSVAVVELQTVRYFSILDLSDKLTYEDAVKRVEPEVGEQGLSLLINNGGVDSFGINVENTSAEEAERVFKVNVTGTLGVTLVSKTIEWIDRFFGEKQTGLVLGGGGYMP